MGKYKNIKIACTFIGTMIGAGFASGREISLYFASTSPLSPLLSGIICGLFCLIFLQLGRISNGDILSYSFGKLSKLILLLIKSGNFIIFCAMLAGSEYLIKRLFNINGGTIISALIMLIFIYLGVEKLKLLNTVIVPMIIVLIIILYFKSKPDILPFCSFNIFSPILYSAMNILSGGYLISTFSKDLSSKDCFSIAIICSIVLSFLLVVIYILIQNTFIEAIPLLFAASLINMERIGCIVLYLAIFSTLTSSLFIITKNNIKYAMLFTSIGLVVACFGFQNIVDKLYPIIGYFGIFVTIIAIYNLIKYNLRQKKLVKID